MKQSLAISYALKKKAKKMAKGGPVDGDVSSSSINSANIDKNVKLPSDIDPNNPVAKSVKKAFGYADGGFVDEEKASGYIAHEGNDVKEAYAAGLEDGQSLNQKGPEMDMVGRIMKQRQMMSEGGKVANGGEDDLDQMADGKPNNFDDLSLRDDLESSYTGANSGDELGDEQEDSDRKDIVSRIMASRRKKDRLPSPA